MNELASNPFTFIAVVFLMSLLPIIVSIGTAYLKFVVVFNLLKNAIGIQQIPPMMVVNALSLIMAVFILSPVLTQVFTLAQEYPGELDVKFMSFFLSEGIEPYRQFLLRNTNPEILNVFKTMASEIWHEDTHHQIHNDNLFILMPSFALTELQEAFEIGFIIYLPFIVIDLIVSNVLLALGMMMMSPMTISLPFKLLLFVFIDGWALLLNNLVLSYQ